MQKNRALITFSSVICVLFTAVSLVAYILLPILINDTAYPLDTRTHSIVGIVGVIPIFLLSIIVLIKKKNVKYLIVPDSLYCLTLFIATRINKGTSFLFNIFRSPDDPALTCTILDSFLESLFIMLIFVLLQYILEVIIFVVSQVCKTHSRMDRAEHR